MVHRLFTKLSDTKYECPHAACYQCNSIRNRLNIYSNTLLSGALYNNMSPPSMVYGEGDILILVGVGVESVFS